MKPAPSIDDRLEDLGAALVGLGYLLATCDDANCVGPDAMDSLMRIMGRECEGIAAELKAGKRREAA